MKVTTAAKGRAVWQTIEAAGKVKMIKVRECNTEAEAKAVAQYIRVRRD